ncbi:hypothetical protein COCON_G00218630 [Conger conger]|uniref:Uncharacterized protein n=1 Tax=Conger conger TaxID=82655 RepID=A0A9Q1CYG9_CONCO|nr:hypothetical protein COCON_G00218630 [Conger conger]
MRRALVCRHLAFLLREHLVQGSLGEEPCPANSPWQNKALVFPACWGPVHDLGADIKRGTLLCSGPLLDITGLGPSIQSPQSELANTPFHVLGEAAGGAAACLVPCTSRGLQSPAVPVEKQAPRPAASRCSQSHFEHVTGRGGFKLSQRKVNEPPTSHCEIIP